MHVHDSERSADPLRKKLADVRPAMAKAECKALAEDEWRRRVGKAIENAIQIADTTKQVLSDAMGYADQSALSRWISGAERPLFDKLLAVAWFQQPLLIALAKCVGAGVRIRTVIEVERVA